MKPETGALDAILNARLASAGSPVALDEELVDLLVFQIDRDWYAFPGSCVREILSQTEIFFVPGCLPSMEGVINVRGDIESVINLSDTLGPRSAGYAPGWVILLGRAGGMQSGIRVDKVMDVLAVAKGSIQGPPASLPEQLQAMVSGVIRYKDRPVALLSLERIFEDYARRLG